VKERIANETREAEIDADRDWDFAHAFLKADAK
jgi:hypothetical protein